MADETVRIERMTLRVAGMSQDEAQRFGREVAECLAEGVESGGPKRSLGAVRIEITAGTEASDRRALAEQVAQRIVKGAGDDNGAREEG